MTKKRLTGNQYDVSFGTYFKTRARYGMKVLKIFLKVIAVFFVLEFIWIVLTTP